MGYDRTCVEQRLVGFGVSDARGREFGCSYVIDLVRWEEGGELRGSYLVQAHTNRGRFPFGPRPKFPRQDYFATIEEARAHAERRVAAYRAAAMKRAGGAT